MNQQEPVDLLDIANKATNWYFRQHWLVQAGILVGLALVIAKNSPNYYVPIPKKLPRKDFALCVKKEVLARQANLCKSCGRFLDVVNFDHIDENPGNNDISNCQALCPNCHAKKTRNKSLL